MLLFSCLKFGDERDNQNYDEAYVNAVLSFCYEIERIFESGRVFIFVFAFKVFVNFKFFWEKIEEKIFPCKFLNSLLIV